MSARCFAPACPGGANRNRGSGRPKRGAALQPGRMGRGDSGTGRWRGGLPAVGAVLRYRAGAARTSGLPGVRTAPRREMVLVVHRLSSHPTSAAMESRAYGTPRLASPPKGDDRLATTGTRPLHGRPALRGRGGSRRATNRHDQTDVHIYHIGRMRRKREGRKQRGAGEALNAVRHLAVEVG